MDIRRDAERAMDPSLPKRPQEREPARVGLRADGIQAQQAPVAISASADGGHEDT